MQLPGPAFCGLIFANGTPQLTPFSPEITVAEQAAKFTISSSATITSIDFWSYELSPPFGGYAGSISWSIYAPDAITGEPSNTVIGATSVTPSRQALGSFTLAGFDGVLYLNSFSVNSVQLPAADYLLGLKNGPASLTSFNGFLWAEVGPPGPLTKGSFTQNASKWVSADLGLAFQIDGTALQPTAEPGTIALVAAGLLTIAIKIVRARRSPLVAKDRPAA